MKDRRERFLWACKTFLAVLRGDTVVHGCDIRGAVNIGTTQNAYVWNNTIHPHVKFNGVPSDEYGIFEDEAQ
jgi:hypothetical protein